MTKAASTGAQPPPADRHDLIRVHGARENNLKDISVELPKRRLTVFTGVSGSGKSSLVFGTIAAESQRLINETYSAFVQGFMPTLARPDVDVLDGLTTAIIVDQQRMGADPRSTVGTATDANAMLRILFSRLGQPYVGPPQAFSFNVASVSGAGAVAFEKGGKTVKERRSFSITGGMCPRCEGRGSVSDIDLTELYDDSKSLNDGALTIPGYTPGGWGYRLYSESGFYDPGKPVGIVLPEKERHDFLYHEPVGITPCAGWVNGLGAIFVGAICSGLVWVAWEFLGSRCAPSQGRRCSGGCLHPRHGRPHGRAATRHLRRPEHDRVRLRPPDGLRSGHRHLTGDLPDGARDLRALRCQRPAVHGVGLTNCGNSSERPSSSSSGPC